MLSRLPLYIIILTHQDINKFELQIFKTIFYIIYNFYYKKKKY